MWSFVTGFFYLAYFQDSFLLYNRMWEYIILSYGQLIFHCMDESHSLNPFTSKWTFGMFLLFGYYEKYCYKPSGTSFL